MDQENGFDGVLRKVWAKGILELLVREVMDLYEGSRISVGVDSVLSELFEVKMGIHRLSVLSPFQR